MSTDPDRSPLVSWREYVDIIVERETRVILTKLSGIEAARTLQALELARRLEELNHAHRQALDDRSEFARRIELENLKAVLDEFRETTSKTLSQYRGRDATLYGLIGLLVACSAVLVAWAVK